MSFILNETNQLLFEGYEKMCEDFYSPNTTRVYLKAFKIIAQWGQEMLGKNLIQLTKEDANCFLEELKNLKHENGEYQLKDSTLERRHSAFISIYHYLGETQGKENIFEGLSAVRIPLEERTEKLSFDYLTDQQVEDLILTIKIHSQNQFLALRDVFIVRLMVSTGITIDELIHLELEQVDFEKGTLTLMDGRVLPLSKKLQENYESYLEERVRYANKKPENKDYVFVSLRGALLSAQNNNTMLSKMAKLCQIPFKLSGSNLRHTYAVRQLKANIPAEVVSKRMGHDKLYYTFRLYSEFIQGEYYEEDIAI